MPARPKRNRRRRSAHITSEAVALFRRGLRDPHNQDIRIQLAAALGRSKFAACPLDREVRSLIGCDREPVEVVLELRAQLLRLASSHLPQDVPPHQLAGGLNPKRQP
jgi:hypothetical protein